MLFRDTTDDYRVAVLRGNSSGGFATADNSVLAAYHNDVGGQGNTYHEAITTGDVNGDGKDEIISIFKDGGRDLNVSILSYDGTSTLKQIWFWDTQANGMGDVAPWGDGIWQNVAPMDVAAGDLDGDFADEVIIAARAGGSDYNHDPIQLIALDVTNLTSNPLVVDTSLWLNYSIQAWEYYAPTVISVATGDFDGDGEDEIALAYNRTFDASDKNPQWDHHLVTFEYVTNDQAEWTDSCAGSNSKRACFVKRSGELDTADRVFSGSVPIQEWRLSIATGDLDHDFRDEVGMVRFKFEGGANDVEVRAYDVDNGLALRSTYTMDLLTNQPDLLAITMGDRDGDSIWGDYVEGSCWVLKEAHLLSVLYAPPHWPEGHVAENYGTTGSSFGAESLDTSTTMTETTAGIGSSVESKIPVKKFKISFTHGWEQEANKDTASSTSSSTGKEWATCPALHPGCSNNVSYTGVQFIQVTNRCYTCADKTNTTGNVDVCLPWTQTENRHSQNWWYTFGPVWYPESFTPVGVNLAQGRTARVSNQESGNPTDAQWAVDGNTDGVYGNNSVAHTGQGRIEDDFGNTIGDTSFWEVDLGGDQWIGAVQLWNRTDAGFTNRLENFYVFVYTGTVRTGDVNALRQDELAGKAYVPGEAGRATIVPVDAEGQHVRVQLFGPDSAPGIGYAQGGAGISATDTDPLDMAELQVDPALPAGADRLAPWVVLIPEAQQVTDGPELTLGIPAAQDTIRMYLREWTLNPVTGDWIIAKSSGWLPYARTTSWTLSAGQGVHYLGVWAADATGNVSTLNELNQVWVNRMDASQSLPAGARAQYRGLANEGMQVELEIRTLAGDPDMYVWKPRSAFRPDGYTDARVAPGQVETIGYTRLLESGRFVVEVGAVGASEYSFSMTGLPVPTPAAAATSVKARPDHPLAVSDPLSARQVGPAATLGYRARLPVIAR
jgi:hypothetical protein